MSDDIQVLNIAKYHLKEGFYTLKELKELVRQIEASQKPINKALERAMRKVK